MTTLPRMLVEWLRLVRSPRARPYLLVTLCVDAALVFVFLVAIQTYLPGEAGDDVWLPGYALAVYGAAKLAAQLIGGRLIDKIGAGRGLIAGLALVAVGQVAFLAAAVTPEAALLAAAVYGLGGAVVWPAMFALAGADFAPDERAQLTSGMTLTTGLALALGLGLGTLLPEDFPYLGATAISLTAIAAALLAATGLRRHDGPGPVSDQPQTSGSLIDAARLIAQPQRLGFSALLFLQSTALGALVAIFRSYGRDVLGVSLREEVLILAPAAAVGAVAVVLGGALSHRLGRIPLLGAGSLLAGLSVWCLSTVNDTSAVIPLAAVAGLGLGLAIPSVSALSLDLSRAASGGAVLGWFLTMEGIGHTAGPALGAWIGSKAGTTAVLWVVGGLFGGVSLVAFLPPIWSVVSLQGAAAARRGNRLVAGAVKGGLVLSLALPVMTTYWAWTPSSQIYGHIITHGPRDQMVVALTFDDGPNAPWTSRIAEVLDRYDVHATFFVVGKNAEAHPEIVRSLARDGHLIGNHSYRHRKRDAIFQLGYGELDKAERAIARAAGVCPAFYRPPNGFHTPWQLHAVSSHDMRTVTWDVIPGDWKRPPPEEIVKRVLESTEPGSIVLLHDGDDTNQGSDRSPTLAALPGIIEGLRAKGYRFVGLDELLSAPAYLPTCDGAVAVAEEGSS